MSTALTISDQLLSSTTFDYMRKYRSQIDRPTAFIKDMEKMGMDKATGGERMIIPLNFTRHSQTTQLQSGYEPINLAVQAPLTPAHEDWYDGIRPVVISGHEERINRGTNKILDLAAVRTKDTEAGMYLDFQQQSLIGGFSNYSDLLSLNGIDNADGPFEGAAYGSQSNTVHNVSKSTYATSVGWNHQYADCANSASANLLVSMYDMMTRIKVLCEDPGKLIWYLSIACATNIKRALNSFERYLSQAELDGGKRVLTFDGTPIREVKDLPNAGTSSTAKPMSALLVSWGDLQFVQQSGYYFKMGQWQSMQGAGFDCRAAFLQLMGQWRINFMAACGVVTKAEIW